ncbi:MAG: DUF11 domain-containing protein, partial [Chloroflexi bacterium]|nr:DUF11 domain-containing protein [Chloroflexota bacterium]
MAGRRMARERVIRRAGWLARVLAVMIVVLGLTAPVATTAGEVTVGVGVSAETVIPGGELTYTVFVANTNPTELSNVRVTYTPPSEFRYVPGSAAVNGVAVADPAASGRDLTWTGLRVAAGNNLYGMHTFVQDTIGDAARRRDQLSWARALAGERGYVTQLFYPITNGTSGAAPAWRAFVSDAYARRLIPVIRLGGAYNPAQRYWERPTPDRDGSGNYREAAAAFARVVNDLPLDGELPLYVEIWNEPNLNLEWSGSANPEQYGRFLRDTAAAIRALNKPKIRILNAAMAPGGDYFHLDFIDAMLTRVPEAKYAFDVWASHPTAGNHPPSYNEDYYS